MFDFRYSTIKILSGSALTSTHLNLVVNLAKQAYKSEDVIPVETHMKIYEKCPDAYIFAIDSENNSVVGYILAIPLEESYFLETINSDFDEKKLDTNYILDMREAKNRIYGLYFSSIVINPNFKKRDMAFRGLIASYVKIVQTLMRKSFYPKAGSAVAVSEVGEKICRSISMRKIGQNMDGYPIYVNTIMGKLFYRSMENRDRQTIIDRALKSLRDNKIKNNYEKVS